MTKAELRPIRAQALRLYLREVKKPITYGAVMSLFGLDRFELKRVLDMMAEIDRRSGDFLTCSYIVDKSGMPKPGFFEYAEKNGLKPSGLTAEQFLKQQQKGLGAA